MENIEKTIKFSILYDIYGPLLKGRDKEVFEDHVMNDLSLAEIADSQGMTRQGVFNIIKNVEKKLLSFEEALHLYSKYEAQRNLIDDICKSLDLCTGISESDKNDFLLKLDEIKQNGI